MGSINPKFIFLALFIFVNFYSVSAVEKPEQTEAKSVTKEIRDLLVRFTSNLDTKNNNEDSETGLTPDEVRKFLKVMDDPEKKQKLMQQVKNTNNENRKILTLPRLPYTFLILQKNGVLLIPFFILRKFL